MSASASTTRNLQSVDHGRKATPDGRKATPEHCGLIKGRQRLTRAQFMCELATDFGLNMAASLSSPERLLFEVRGSPSPAALEVAGLLTDQFEDDVGFRDDVVGWVASAGHLLAEAPGINADLKTASASDCVEAVIKAGMTPVVFRTPDSPGGFQLAFFAGGRRADPNIHLLVENLVDRFNGDVGFAQSAINCLSEKSLTYTGRLAA